MTTGCWRSIRGPTIQHHLASPQKNWKYRILVKWFKCEIDRHLPLNWCVGVAANCSHSPPHWIRANKTLNGAAISLSFFLSQFYFRLLDYLMHSNCSQSLESDSCLAHNFCYCMQRHTMSSYTFCGCHSEIPWMSIAMFYWNRLIFEYIWSYQNAISNFYCILMRWTWAGNGIMLMVLVCNGIPFRAIG